MRYISVPNFDDLDPLRERTGSDRQWLHREPFSGDADLVLMPGSKSIADLGFFRSQGWDIDLFAHHRRGRVLGLCGSLNAWEKISDLRGIEGPRSQSKVTGLIDVRPRCILKRLWL